MRWAIAILFLAGLLVRLPGLSAPPLDFHPTRQYRAAILARAMYLDEMRGLTPEQVAAARAAVGSAGTLEPPVVERLAAWGYRLAGREDLRIARLVSVLAWVAGAAALAWLLALLFAARVAVVVGLAVMLLLPFAIVASRAIQPDSLMTALTVFAIALAVRHDRRGGAIWLVSTFAASALAIFIKPMAAFFVLPVIAVLAMERLGWVRGMLLAGVAAVAVVLPITAYFAVNGWPAPDYSLFTRLAGTTSYWSNWSAMLRRVVGFPLVVAAVVGVAVAPRPTRSLLLSLWFGYLVFGVAFAYRVSTHDYYSLPLVPVVALSVAALAEAAARRWRSFIFSTVVVVAVAAGLAVNAATIRAAGLVRAAAELRARADGYERIGEVVGHSSRVVTLDDDYGYPLSYHGFLRAANLPLRGDLALDRLAGRSPAPAEERLKSISGDFFVATSQAEVAAQPDLLVVVDRQYRLIARDGTPERWNYLIYDLRATRLSLTPERLSFFALSDGSRSSKSSAALWIAARAAWRLEVPADAPFDVSPREGSGPAPLTFAPRPVAPEIDRIVDVAVVAAGGSEPSATLAVRFRSVRALPGTPPFGFVDLPPDPVRIGEEPVTFQGWALDAFDFRRVWAGYLDANGRTVEVAAARIIAMRHDVAAVHPTAHDIYNDAWALELQPSALASAPPQVLLRFYAENGDGRRAEIGARTIVRR